jgi:hypothetical protein
MVEFEEHHRIYDPRWPQVEVGRWKISELCETRGFDTRMRVITDWDHASLQGCLHFKDIAGILCPNLSGVELCQESSVLSV